MRLTLVAALLVWRFWAPNTRSSCRLSQHATFCHPRIVSGCISTLFLEARHWRRAIVEQRRCQPFRERCLTHACLCDNSVNACTHALPRLLTTPAVGQGPVLFQRCMVAGRGTRVMLVVESIRLQNNLASACVHACMLVCGAFLPAGWSPIPSFHLEEIFCKS